MTLPHHTAPTSLMCHQCRSVYRIPGVVFAVIGEDGTVLWYRCRIGHRVDPTAGAQLDLFGDAA